MIDEGHMYINTTTSELYTAEHIMQRHCIESSIELTDEVIHKLGYQKVKTVPIPQYDPSTQYVLMIGVRFLQDGTCEEVYEVRDISK